MLLMLRHHTVLDCTKILIDSISEESIKKPNI
ncbi:MAG: hypothetical protein ACI8WW_002906 [Oceanospirillaceae bacterium]|jgi:hypothetical protein